MFLLVCFVAAMFLREAAGECGDFSLFRGLAGIVVDTCPQKRGTCCGKANSPCISTSSTARCRCPPCPTTTPLATAPIATNTKNAPVGGGGPATTPLTASTAPAETITAPQAECGSLNTNCEMCLTYDCLYCVESKACVRRGEVCAVRGDVAQPQCPAPVDGGPQQVMIGNVTVNVTVTGQFDRPIGNGLSFTWTFDPVVGISWIELGDFVQGEQAVLTITRTADGTMVTVPIAEARQDLIDRTESGFNVYRLEAVGNSTFKVNTLSIVPAVSTPKTEPPPAPLSPTAAPAEPGTIDGLAIGLIVGGILLCLLALAIVLFVVRRRRRQHDPSVTITGTPEVATADPSRVSVYGGFSHQASNGGVPSQYGAAPASVSDYTSSRRGQEIVYEASAPPDQKVVYGDAPALMVVYGNSQPYTDPRRQSNTTYDDVDMPLH